MSNASRDKNRITTLLGTSSVDGTTPITIYADPTTHRLFVDASISAATIANHFQTDTFTSTNNQTVFTASTTVVADFFVSVNGSIQTPATDYTVSGNTLTLSSGIPSGNIVVWKYII